jgi:hypothetical protein
LPAKYFPGNQSISTTEHKSTGWGVRLLVFPTDRLLQPRWTWSLKIDQGNVLTPYSVLAENKQIRTFQLTARLIPKWYRQKVLSSMAYHGTTFFLSEATSVAKTQGTAKNPIYAQFKCRAQIIDICYLLSSFSVWIQGGALRASRQYITWTQSAKITQKKKGYVNCWHVESEIHTYRRHCSSGINLIDWC